MNKLTEKILLGIISLGLLAMIIIRCVELNRVYHFIPAISSIPIDSSRLQPEPEVRSGDLILGQTIAPITVFIYTSYQCKACTYFFSEIYPEVKEKMINTGDIQLVIRGIDFQNDPNILLAQKATLCFANDGRFDEIIELFAAHDDLMTSHAMTNFVEDLLYEDPEMGECILSDLHNDQFYKNREEFQAMGLSGVPTIIVGAGIYRSVKSVEALNRIVRFEIRKKK